MKEHKHLTNQEKIWIALNFDVIVNVNGRTGIVKTYTHNVGSERSIDSINEFEVEYLYRSNPREDKLTESFEINNNLKIELI